MNSMKLSFFIGLKELKGSGDGVTFIVSSLMNDSGLYKEVRFRLLSSFEFWVSF